MPRKTATKKTGASARPKAKVVNNRSGSSSLGIFRSKFGALVVAILFMAIGAGTIGWVKAATTTHSLWATSTVPKTISDSDSQSVELGTKFRAKYSGKVTAMRFYKGPLNTGKHVGNLWTSDGRKLASVTFKNETASGWQTANFATPVDVSANTTYVISYFAPKGHYAVNENYFKSDRVNGPLTAPKGSNGVYVYSGQSAFPRQTYHNSNYWVDVVYSTSRFSPTPKPVAPSDLKATVTGTSVTLKWTASPSTGVTKHEVLRDGQVIGWGSPVSNFTDTGLAKGKTYSYQVRAVDSTGQVSDLSNAAKATIASDPAPTPTPTPTPVPTPTPTPTPTPNPNAGWPGPNTTGPNNSLMPETEKKQLTAYSGPCTITASNTVIDSKIVNCRLSIGNNAQNVVIKNSQLNGGVYNDLDLPTPGSVTVSDSEIDGKTTSQGAVTFVNFTLIRSNIRGGQHNILCAWNCKVYDSWLHDPYLPSNDDWHNNTFISNGGHDMEIVRNTLSCNTPNNSAGGGCSSHLSLFGDFATNSRILIDGNLFVAGGGASWCTYGGTSGKPYNADNVVYRNNVFQRGSNGRCAYGGAVTDFSLSRPGNKWENNKWDDGSVLNP
jgi:hypothetical protein